MVSNYNYYFSSKRLAERREREDRTEDVEHDSHRGVVNGGEYRTDSRRTGKQVQETQLVTKKDDFPTDLRRGPLD